MYLRVDDLRRCGLRQRYEACPNGSRGKDVEL
jgi:hypothetical protein